MDDAIRASVLSIVESVEPGSALTGLQKLSGGQSYQLRRVDFERPDGESGSLVLREATNLRSDRWGMSLAREFQLVSELHALGLAVPRPRMFDDSGKRLRHPFAVFDWIEGAPLLAANDPKAVGVAVADAMLAIHSVPTLELTRSGLTDWTDFAGSVIDAEPTAFDHGIGEEAIREALRSHPAPEASNPDCLLHGDLWPGNIIAQDGSIAAVIDWENAAVGDPLGDLAITRLELLWTFGVKATTAFTRHYLEQHPIDSAALPYWDLFAALRPAGDLHEWAEAYPELGRPDVNYDTMRAGHRWFVAQAVAAL